MTHNLIPGTAYKFAHRRVMVVEEVVEEWDLDHRDALQARDIASLIGETTALLDPINRLFDCMSKGIENDTRAGDFVLAHTVGNLLNKAAQVCRKVGDVVENVQKSGMAIDGLDRLRECEQRLAHLSGDFSRKWLLPDLASVKTAKEEIAAGLFRML